MAARIPTRERLVELFLEAGRPLNAREVAARLELRDRLFPRLLDALEKLAAVRVLRELPGQRFQLISGASGEDVLEGVISVHPRGFAFVSATGQDDVFVPGESIGGALHGDRVRVTIVGRTSRGREGRVSEVLQRRAVRVAGTLRVRGKSAWIEPDDARMRGPIVLPGIPHEGTDGLAAVARITRFPELQDETVEGEIVGLLGAAGTIEAEVAKVLMREQVEEGYPEPAIREARELKARMERDGAGGKRVDLRAVPLPTIDPEDARDHDDAVWVERAEGGYRAWVAIADVSEYVQPDGALDAEARQRGCTIYLPDRAIPMLPSELAADRCSLLPDVDRLCLCVRARLDNNGDVESYDVVEGEMRSAAKLTYGGVARTLGFTEEPAVSPAAEALKPGLEVLAELAGKLRRRRMARGALDLDLPEAHVVVDPKRGMPISVKARAVDPGMKRAYNLIEELMLLANELMAQFLREKESHAVYRVHGHPDEAKLARLAEVGRMFGVPIDPEALQEPTGVGQLLRQLDGHPRKGVLQTLLLRSLKQASYDVENIGHFGLASDGYLHFTSPIRRYPDLLVHRLVKRLLRGQAAEKSEEALEVLRESAARASARERVAMEVEREVVDLYRAVYMRDFLGEVFEGTVTSVVGGGVFVMLDDPFVDVMIRLESLGPDRYELADDQLAVVGATSGDRIGLGDVLTLEIEDISLARRQVYGRRVPPDAVVNRMVQKTRTHGFTYGKAFIGARRGTALTTTRFGAKAAATSGLAARSGPKPVPPSIARMSGKVSFGKPNRGGSAGAYARARAAESGTSGSSGREGASGRDGGGRDSGGRDAKPTGGFRGKKRR